MLLYTLHALLIVQVLSKIVVLPDGTQLKGKERDSNLMFLGVPYAQPPVDSLRWSPPQPWINEDKSKVVDATQYGSPCCQGFTRLSLGEEDCLFLNIYVPVETNSSAIPVGFFIHGGSYRTGTGNMYSGKDMVNYFGGQAIIVTINYRLNVFGFIGSEELRIQDKVSGSTGVYGYQDQRLAMEWVRQNIATFGGDPNNVMIFGESAGAGSVSSHLVMKKSRGLFQSAIMESGSFSQWIVNNMSNAEKIYSTLSQEAGCSDDTAQSPLDCMLSKSTEEIFEASVNVHSLDLLVYDSPYYPTVDGVELTTHPWISLAKGDVVDVPILHGTNSDEGSMFSTLPSDATMEDLQQDWVNAGYTPDQVDSLNKLYVIDKTYPNTTASEFWYAGERSLGDSTMSCPAQYVSDTLKSLTSHTSSVYLYHFEHQRTNTRYVSHFSEVPFIFHWEYIMRNEPDQKMADIMTSYWGNFLIDEAHNPNGGEVGASSTLPEWMAYTSPGQEAIALVDQYDIEQIQHLKKEECDFFVPLLDATIRAYFPE